MKKLIFILLVVIMFSNILAGCGAPSADPELKTDDGINAPTTGYSVSDSYSRYNTAKTDMVSNISDALTSNSDTVFVSLKLAGVFTADISLVPASLFGLGQEGVVAGMQVFGHTDVKYTENGNNYTIEYTDSEGKVYCFNGTYDASADSLITNVTENGVDIIYSEYRKTSFGYIGQHYISSEESSLLYQFSIKGNDGVIGISEGTAKPAGLTGGEADDFPSNCIEWYAIDGNTVTGKTADGAAVNFEYIPE